MVRVGVGREVERSKLEQSLDGSRGVEVVGKRIEGMKGVGKG